MAGKTVRRIALTVLVALLAAAAMVVVIFWPGSDEPPSPAPVAPYDYISAKAAELEHDPDRIIAFVRDQVAPQEYPGSLRGSVGTLWGGRGNDVDRADLLAALLKESGRKVRFAKGESTWVQVLRGGKWEDVRLSVGDESGRPDWTGETLPEELRHRLVITLELIGKDVNSRQSIDLPTARLAGRPLVVSFDGARCTVSLVGTDRRIELAVNAAADETLLLRFAHQAPGQAKPRVVTREIYSRKYPDYRVMDDPRNRHVATVTTGRVSRWAYERELKLANAGRKGFADAQARESYLPALSHVVESDEALGAIEKHFRTSARFARPRVVIASTYFGKTGGQATYRALDLRWNAVEASAGDDARAALSVTRAAYEGALEADVLARATGAPVLGAMEVLTQLFDRVRPSTPERLRFYAGSLERLLREMNPGARITFSLDAKRRVVFARGQGEQLIVESISEVLAARMKQAGVEWEVLTSGKVTPRTFGRAALELETLLGPVAGAPTDYRPTLDVEESTEELLATNSRVFISRRLGLFKMHRVTLEYQILATEGDVRYESIDYWDEINKKSIRKSLTFTIPAKSVASSDLLSRHYSQRLYDKGSMFLFASEKVHRELKEDGQTVVRYMKRDGTPTEPLRLFVCERKEVDVYVNNRKRKLPFLYVAGGYVKDNPKPKPYAAVKPILVDGKWLINKYDILDNPRFPLINVSGARFQTAIPGTVVSSRTGLGVPDAKVVVEGTSSSGTTWGDGRFMLPIVKKKFAEFNVSINHPGYAPRRVEVDFRRPDVFPLCFELQPQPQPKHFIWVTTADVDARLAELSATDRVKDLIRRALEDNPDLVAMVPATRIPFGGSSTRAWLLFDNATFHITGATEDGLHSASAASGMMNDWARNAASAALGGPASPYETQTGVINYYAGHIASWYVYSAGKLDVIARMIEGEEFDDLGHAHAMGMAMSWLEGMSALTEGAGSWAGGAAGLRSEQFKAGFLRGLEFFGKNPEFRGQ